MNPQPHAKIKMLHILATPTIKHSICHFVYSRFSVSIFFSYNSISYLDIKCILLGIIIFVSLFEYIFDLLYESLTVKMKHFEYCEISIIDLIAYNNKIGNRVSPFSKRFFFIVSDSYVG